MERLVVKKGRSLTGEREIVEDNRRKVEERDSGPPTKLNKDDDEDDEYYYKDGEDEPDIGEARKGGIKIEDETSSSGKNGGGGGGERPVVGSWEDRVRNGDNMVGVHRALLDFYVAKR